MSSITGGSNEPFNQAKSGEKLELPGGGIVYPGEGWTKLVNRSERVLISIDAVLTGFYEPQASHLAMLQAHTGKIHLIKAYKKAINEGYLWHKFGDLHLLLS